MKDIPEISLFKDRLKVLDEQMLAPDFFQNSRKSAEIARERQNLTRLVDSCAELEKVYKHWKENEELLKDLSEEDEMYALAEEDLENLKKKADDLYQTIIESMIPSDPNDSKNTIVEIRAGTGGEEAGLFAGDLFRMYNCFAEIQGWKIEVLSSSPSEKGGFKEVIFLITGEDVYKMLRFEAGGHRVQRVPTTETNGRIHTSAATVAILPEAEEVDLVIKPEDLEIRVCRASGPGGQSVNTTDSAVQILHKPTGLTVQCADERSQQKNKVKGMKVLRSRLLQKMEEEEHAKYAQNRKNQIGSGDRSERIRTYNFPQNRLTDHRIGLTLYNLTDVMEGNLLPVIKPLQEADIRMKLENK